MHLLTDVVVGEPDVSGALAVFPLFSPAGALEYVSFAEGAARGVTVGELPSGASVNDLLVVNPSASGSCSTRARSCWAPSRTAPSTGRSWSRQGRSSASP